MKLNKIDKILKVVVSKRKNSYWDIIKKAFKDALEAEKTSAGRANLIGGLAVLIVVLLVCVPSTLIDILNALFSGFELAMPWQGILIAIGLLVVYFIYCVKTLMDIEKLKR